MTLSTRDTRRCRAHNNRGEPCGLFPMHGGTVCSVHGGKAPQVRRAAAVRIAEALDDMLAPALIRLRQLIDEESSAVALATVKEIIDRHIGKSKERIEANIMSDFTLRIDRDTDDNG